MIPTHECLSLQVPHVIFVNVFKVVMNPMYHLKFDNFITWISMTYRKPNLSLSNPLDNESIQSYWQFRLCKNRISELQELTTMYSLLNLWALGAPIIRFLKLFTFTSVSSSNFPLSSRDSWLNRSSPRLIDLLMSCWKKAPTYKFLTHYMLHQFDLHYTGPMLRDIYCNSSIQTLQTTKEWSIQQGIRHILMKVQRCSNLDDASVPSMFLQRQSHQCQNLESFLRLS
jgi:hypothetical protein